VLANLGQIKRYQSFSVVSRDTMGPDELRRHAREYREIAKRITDARTVKHLNDLADECEARADDAQADAQNVNRRSR